MEEAQDSLLSPGEEGPITSRDQRSFNSMMMDYFNSFLDCDAYVNEEGKISDARLSNRTISKVVLCQTGLVIGEDCITKPFTSDTIEFIDLSFSPNTHVTISFKQQPI